MLACPVQIDPNGGGMTAPPPSPTCCGPGTYLCGCGGLGQCIPTDQPCPLLCPACDPTTVATPCGCLPPGAVCGCDPNTPSTVPCQCDPTVIAATDPNGTGGGVSYSCTVDAGSPCQPGEYLSPCGCIPENTICSPPQPGGCTDPTQQSCCDGTCAGPNGICPQVCFVDGGTTEVDGGVCPQGTARCPNSNVCQPAGVPCMGP